MQHSLEELRQFGISAIEWHDYQELARQELAFREGVDRLWSQFDQPGPRPQFQFRDPADKALFDKVESSGYFLALADRAEAEQELRDEARMTRFYEEGI